MRGIACIILLLVIQNTWAQRKEFSYRTKGDTIQNYYLALVPKDASKGLLLILPGFGTTPGEVLQETDLPRMACDSGYTVIIPLLVNYEVIDTLQLFQKRLESLIPEVIRKYNIPKNKFIIGGHSLGGHQALYYAEQAWQLHNRQLTQPNAVFGVDPPLDMKRLWDSFAYNVRINFSKTSAEESVYMMNYFEKLYGGSPYKKPKVYEKYSSFYRTKDGGNIKYLKNVPVRLYCDPDINWMIENRRTSYEYINAADLSACISQLKLLGNSQAELVVCLGKGFLPDGRRHPHAFSMLDAKEFISWMHSICNKQ